MPDQAIFWLHIASFSIYNVLIGYLLVSDFNTLRPLALFFSAMVLHLLIYDFRLSEQFKGTHHRIGRWLSSGSLFSAHLLVGLLKLRRQQ
ncbi:MAG: hypothetical protein ACJ8G3_08405 [Burkholderiaceae bacterium]